MHKFTFLILFIIQIVFGQDNFDRQSVLFGIEYSFQDQVIVNEPGRNTFRTEHKAKKFEAFTKHYLKSLNLTESSIITDTSKGSFKPGYVIKVPSDGNHVVNMEPVTIEVNGAPRTIDQIESTSKPIFESAAKSELVPYVNPAAERSGMGHIHIGAKTIGQSPFYKHPNLLRNIMVFYHKHPSLLYGFAEAYDIGENSNIETFHSKDRQAAFKKAVTEFDQWYLTNPDGREEKGLQKFLELLADNTPVDKDTNTFFRHYRNVNLEHLAEFAYREIDPNLSGKYTVEFRGFRPQKSPKHALANAELLLDIMESMSSSDYLEPFEKIGDDEFKRFWSAGKIKSDWQEVKQLINHRNKYSDSMIQELVLNMESKTTKIKYNGRVIQVLPAYSIKEHKGTGFEIRVSDSKGKVPQVKIGNKIIEMEQAIIDKKRYWIGYIDSNVIPEFNLRDIQSTSFDINYNISHGQFCGQYFVPKAM